MKSALTLVVALIPAVLSAQKPTGPVQDNSFLMEEAYNQEARVVQHISVFNHSSSDGSWGYAFTQEWPFRSQRHQLSYTIPIAHAPGNPSATGIGDIALNYRYQLVGSGQTRLAVAPRMTLLVPTGSTAKGFGAGQPGGQLELPVSWMLTPRLATHWNGGVMLQPRVKVPGGVDVSVTTFNLGQSFVYLLTPTLNLMLETVWTRASRSSGTGAAVATKSLLVSPGVRYALNFESGLQVVPGIAFPIGVGPSSGQHFVLLYLSFEHPF